jgi:1-acyl-sn-glycerol-3-phosphate acyltransferase
MSSVPDFETKMQKVMPLLQAVRLYHKHEVIGLESVPERGAAIIVVNHSLATYDIVLLTTAIYAELKRLTRPLIDRLFFRIPFVGEFAEMFGSVQGSQQTAQDLLEAGEVITVAPGGMREALRPSTERYQIRWDRRIGFVRLAMRTRAPVILAACPKADDLYDVYPSALTAWMYKQFRVPVFLARGLGPTPVPRPIKLVHFLSEPHEPPEWIEGDDDGNEDRARAFHGRLVQSMHTLIGEAIQHR